MSGDNSDMLSKFLNACPTVKPIFICVVFLKIDFFVNFAYIVISESCTMFLLKCDPVTIIVKKLSERNSFIKFNKI